MWLSIKLLDNSTLLISLSRYDKYSHTRPNEIDSDKGKLRQIYFIS